MGAHGLKCKEAAVCAAMSATAWQLFRDGDDTADAGRGRSPPSGVACTTGRNARTISRAEPQSGVVVSPA